MVSKKTNFSKEEYAWMRGRYGDPDIQAIIAERGNFLQRIAKKLMPEYKEQFSAPRAAETDEEFDKRRAQAVEDGNIEVDLVRLEAETPGEAKERLMQVQAVRVRLLS